MPVPTVDLRGNSYDDREEKLLHFDRDRMMPVVEKVWEALRLEAIAQNPHLDPTEAAERMLCGGCILTFFSSLSRHVLDQAGADRREREKWNDRLSDLFAEENDPLAGLLRQLFRSAEQMDSRPRR